MTGSSAVPTMAKESGGACCGAAVFDSVVEADHAQIEE